MIRYTTALFFALLFHISVGEGATTSPVTAEMTIAKLGTKTAYTFDWHEVGKWGVGDIVLKWSNFDPGIHAGGFNFQDARIKMLVTPKLPAGCKFDLWGEIKEDGADSGLRFRVWGAPCRKAFQDLAKGDFVLEFYHVPQLGNMSSVVVPQLNLTISGH